MPANSFDFRAVCGLFRSIYIPFMAERTQLAIDMRVRVVKVSSRRMFLLFVFVAHLLLQCGDIEANPGPPPPTS
ncbi:hypothetical protein BaRGS_00031784 [Batillaria attramentaria]|uniref:Uncharacterized protein n=1 Tax=Batillaria attramentaria TaxID=370345 RepID=A0ABD0JPK4_9CAEN